MRAQTIDIPTCTGSVLDHGAHVMEWQPRDERPVVFTSDAAVYAQDTAIRGGVPVCFPWFGPGREPGSPYGHGFARTTTWHQVGNDVTDDAQTVTYRLSQDDATDDYWPHAYWALLTARFSTNLTVSLAVTNLDSVAFSYEAALHTYLCVDDIRRVRIEGLDGASYVDKTADMQVREQSGDLTFWQETDSVYASPGPVRVLDPVAGREITVSTEGASHIVVWNPWEEKAAGLPDLGPGEWERFVCVEAGRVFDGAVVLDPGESHTLSTTIAVARP
ncbi:D-hexose-6-phosphate mutarotase [Nostocoides sp. F2B08]|uniref:D-hexose-6-phosphate mutarotase n=1 Tax=Nostocoides sp. F2B08 TaxID=2653936 RepID=UPI0012634B15|nr:D-hexose-6-phosphate mutarotase [Tetrasphaera sp. F2B08]KAB7745117.1 D-hexose-6-phosphate mutarotase [Tetrasphaera sp. F2B08]